MQDLHQYLQIDFLERKVMWAVGVQGRPHGHAWVSEFYITYGERPDKMAFVRDKFGMPEVADSFTLPYQSCSLLGFIPDKVTLMLQTFE